MKLTEQLYEQFLPNVKFTDGKCWLWKGARTGGGYGCFSVDGVKYRAHRLAVTLFLDPGYDPAGRGHGGDFVIHDCDTPPCVSPLCVKPGTASQNTQDAYARCRIDIETISQARKGKKLTAKTKAKIGEMVKITLNRPEVKEKHSKALLGNQNSLGPKQIVEKKAKQSGLLRNNQYGAGNKGKRFTAAHKAKISKARKKYWNRIRVLEKQL